MDADGGMSLP